MERPGQAEAAAPRCASGGRPTLATRPLPSPGYGTLGEALRSTRARGSGRRLSGHFSGKGCSQSGLPQLLRGREAGILPQPQTLKEILD